MDRQRAVSAGGWDWPSDDTPADVHSHRMRHWPIGHWPLCVVTACHHEVNGACQPPGAGSLHVPCRELAWDWLAVERGQWAVPRAVETMAMHRLWLALLSGGYLAGALKLSNLSSCTTCYGGGNSDRVTINIMDDSADPILTTTTLPQSVKRPRDRPVAILMDELNSDVNDQFLYLTQHFQAKDPQMAVVFIDVIWPGDLAEHLSDMSTLLTEAQLEAPVDNERQFATVNGVQVAAPWFIDSGFLYYRKDLLAKYNFDHPPTTWAELEHMAQTIQDGERPSNNAFVGYVWQGRAYEGLTCDVLELVTSHGGGNVVESDKRVTVNNPAALKALRRMVHWTDTISGPAVTGYTETETLNMYLGMNAAFMRNWPYAISNIRATGALGSLTGITLLPNDGPGTTSHGTLGGFMVAVSKSATNQRAAAHAVSVIVSEQTQKWNFHRINYMPVNKDIYFGRGLCNASDSGLQVCDVAVPENYTVPRWSTAASPNYQDSSAVVYNAVNAALLKKISPEGALLTMECQLVQMLHGIQALPQQCIQAVEAKQWAWVINIVLVAIGTVAVVIVLGVIAAYTHHPVIASASPLFCVTICLGAIMLLLSNITSGTLPVSSSSCWSTAWLTTLGFSLMFGALFFKTWRVTQVFSMTSTSKHIISNVDLAVRLAAFMLFNVALLAVWMVIQGTTSPARKVFQAPQQCPSASLTFTLLPYVDQCDYHPAGLYAIGLVMAAVIAWGTMLAYRTRNVPLLLFNESKHIAICMYTVAIVSALAVPTLVAMVGNPTVSLLIRTTATFLLVLACVGSLFIPKFLIMSAYTIAEIKAMDGSTNNQQTRPPSVLGDHKPASTQMRTGAQGNFSSAIRGAASTTGSTA